MKFLIYYYVYNVCTLDRTTLYSLIETSSCVWARLWLLSSFCRILKSVRVHCHKRKPSWKAKVVFVAKQRFCVLDWLEKRGWLVCNTWACICSQVFCICLVHTVIVSVIDSLVEWLLLFCIPIFFCCSAVLFLSACPQHFNTLCLIFDSILLLCVKCTLTG